MKTTNTSAFYNSIIGISAVALAASAINMNHRPFHGFDQDAGSDLYLNVPDGNFGGGSGTTPGVDDQSNGKTDLNAGFSGELTGQAGIATGHATVDDLDPDKVVDDAPAAEAEPGIAEAQQ